MAYYLLSKESDEKFFSPAQDDSLYLPLRMTIGQWGALAFSFGSLKTADRRDVPSAIGQ
jgi:hypothetical protein